MVYFYHPISEELKVKGEISFETSFPYKSEEFKNNVYELMFDMFQSEEKFKASVKSGTIISGQNPVGVDSKKKMKIGEKKKTAKRKFVSELVNPNAKRRKNKGAKFVAEDDDETKNDAAEDKENDDDE